MIDNAKNTLVSIPGINISPSAMYGGQIDIMKLKPISFDPVHNGYHVIGDKVGNAFSDGKELDK